MKRLWIIGFRAAGKTTWGRELARMLGIDFLDLDEQFEKRGISVLEFVEKNGLEAFRREEEGLLRAAEQAFRGGKTGIVATGGGFVDWPPSRTILESSRVPKLFLDPPADLLWQRLAGQPDRQKIGHLSTPAALQSLLETRRPFYEKIASVSWKDQDINGCLMALKSLAEKPATANET